MATCSLIVFLIDESLRDLQSLHLSHGLAIALSLPWLDACLVLTTALSHSRNLSLQKGTVLPFMAFATSAISNAIRVIADNVATCYNFLANTTGLHSFLIY